MYDSSSKTFMFVFYNCTRFQFENCFNVILVHNVQHGQVVGVAFILEVKVCCLQILIATVVGWTCSAIITVAGGFSMDNASPDFYARTDSRMYIVRDTDWFIFPYPGIYIIRFLCYMFHVPWQIDISIFVQESIHSKIYTLQTNIYIDYDNAPTTKDDIKKGKSLFPLWSLCGGMTQIERHNI